MNLTSEAIYPEIPVSELLTEKAGFLGLMVVHGQSGLNRRILMPIIQKPGLPLTGDIKSLYRDRIQILGKSEINFLNNLSDKDRLKNLRSICSSEIPCFIITRGLEAPAELKALAESFSVPVLSCMMKSAALADQITRFLSDILSPYTNLHGTLVEIHGLGVLLIGESGIGKSECALNLITKGHRLITDDRVILQKRTGNKITGLSPEDTRFHMELRGIGLINIKDMFGAASILFEKTIDLIVTLEAWKEGKNYDRLGLDEQELKVLDTGIPHLVMPVAPGRNTAVLVEVAARNHLLKMGGYHAARNLSDRIQKKLLRNTGDE